MTSRCNDRLHLVGDGCNRTNFVRQTYFVRLTGFAEKSEGAEHKSRRLAEHYDRAAQERGCAFLDAGQVFVSTDLDGIHLEASGREKLGRAVAAKLRDLLACQISGLG